MMCYSVQLRYQIFVKGYVFLSFPKNMVRNISKNICKNLSGKYSQTLLNHTKESATDVFVTASEIAIQKMAEELVIWLVIKLLIKLQKFKKNHNKRI